jgi:phosphopentomutase
MAKRALIIVLDSVGVGGAPDAAAYGDEGADTLGHLLDRFPDLRLPALWSMGLGHVVGRDPAPRLCASYGRMTERSAGKDSTTGHWELAGAILDEPFGVFEKFPPELVRAIERDAGVRFIGNEPASGTEIIERLGAEHVRTAKPILYTSADSVLQIAAHEAVIPIERLYEICRIARRHADPYRIGRVIARPFVGEPGRFTRTPRRHDFSMPPPRTVLNALVDAGVPVKAVGKTSDLFAGSGISESHPTESNADGMRVTERVWRETTDGLVFTNLVDFDAVFGHRRDPDGYARALVEFDEWLAGFLSSVGHDDLLIVTADHGNDPTFRGTDHTREQVPLLVRFRGRAADLGTRDTFADVAATLAGFFRVAERWPIGRPFLTMSNHETELHDVPADPPRRARARQRDDPRPLAQGRAERPRARPGGGDGATRGGGQGAAGGGLRQPGRARAADRRPAGGAARPARSDG